MKGKRGRRPNERGALGTLLFEHRKRVGVTLTQLADTMGMTQGYCSNVEVGRKRPTEHFLDAAGKAFKLTVDERDALYHAAGIIPPELRQALLDHPMRWRMARVVLDAGAP